MVGRSQASNLSGMLSQLSDTIGEMGGPGEKYLDTFRRLQAPDPDMSSSSSLQEYAEWARRNGYDAEADRYMALAYEQKQKELALAKENTQIDAQAQIAGHMRNIKSIETNPTIKDESKRRQLIEAEQAKINELAANGRLDSTAYANVGANALQASSERYITKNYREEMNKLTDEADNLYRGMKQWDSQSPEYGHLKAAYDRTIQKMNDLSQTSRGGDGSRAGDQFALAKREIELANNREQRAANAEVREQAAADRAEKLAPYQLQNAQNKILMDQYKMNVMAQEQQGATIAQGLINQKITSPNALPDNMPPAAYAEALKRLNDYREAQLAQSEAQNNGTVSPYMMEKAKLYAPYVPDLQKLLDQYEDQRKKGLPVFNGERIRVANQILAQIKTREDYMTSANGQLKYEAGAALKGLASMGDASSPFENETIKSILADAEAKPEQFNAMRDALAEYMAGNNIQTFNNVTELYAAIDTVLPTMADGVWHQAFNKVEQQRDAYKEQFLRHQNSQKQAYIDYHWQEKLSEDPSYAQYPEETKRMLAENFEKDVRDISEFMDAATDLTRSAPVEKVGAQNSRAFGGGRALTPQQRMMLNGSNEWATVVDMVGEEVAEVLRDKIMAGYPVTYADLDMNPKKKGIQVRAY